jgi:anti-sigma regulatory factor (Ser/Thr protein kinase)
MILSELFNNALDHGLLGLDSSLKDAPDGYERYLEARAERLAQLSSGRIDMGFHLRMEADKPVLDITFSDTGCGFKYGRYAENRDRAAAMTDGVLPHGRGIMLINAMCQSLVYSGIGNRVTARYAL